MIFVEKVESENSEYFMAITFYFFTWWIKILKQIIVTSDQRNHKNKRLGTRMESADMLKAANLLPELDSQVACVFICEGKEYSRI